MRIGARGATLLEDCLLRQKNTHVDPERIPERIVHARGSAAHGTFEQLRDCSPWTRAHFLGAVGRKAPVFTRLSTVAGGAGSADAARDVRGFAVKFYTDEGHFDLVGNNMSVFFIQDAIKFPDLLHAVKMVPDRGFPQAASAHDTFWDFVSLMPEATHMVLWAMGDRTLPRSPGAGHRLQRRPVAPGSVVLLHRHPTRPSGRPELSPAAGQSRTLPDAELPARRPDADGRAQGPRERRTQLDCPASARWPRAAAT